MRKPQVLADDNHLTTKILRGREYRAEALKIKRDLRRLACY
jgi:hypothetical protein